jgi:hypothetical protein
MSESPPDPILANAIARRDAALAEARRWEEFIKTYRLLQGAPPYRSSDATGAHFATGRAAQTRPAAGAISATEALAREIISEKGRAVSTREMLEELTARGHIIGGKDPASTLSARLSRAPSLENQRPVGWRIRHMDSQIGGAGLTSSGPTPARSDRETPSSPVEPGAGGGT